MSGEITNEGLILKSLRKSNRLESENAALKEALAAAYGPVESKEHYIMLKEQAMKLLDKQPQPESDKTE